MVISSCWGQSLHLPQRFGPPTLASAKVFRGTPTAPLDQPPSSSCSPGN